LKRLFVALIQANRDETNQYTDVAADVQYIYQAGEGKFGTDEVAFISILCNRGEAHLRAVFDAYQR